MKFRTTIVQSGKTATGIVVPEAVMEALGAGRRPPVRVTIGAYSYRSTVATVDGSPMVGLSAENRAAAGVAGGDEVEVDVVLDTEKREVAVPARARRRARCRAAGARHVRRPVEQQQVVARAPGDRREDRRDP